jgi:hypothetical protein
MTKSASIKVRWVLADAAFKIQSEVTSGSTMSVLSCSLPTWNELVLYLAPSESNAPKIIML